MNNLQLPLGALFDLTAQIYDFAINKGVDFASTVTISITEGQADIYIFTCPKKDGETGLTSFLNLT